MCIYLEWLYTRLRAKLAVSIASAFFTFHMKVSIHTASLEIVHAYRVRPVTGLMASRKQHLEVYWPVLGTVSAPGRPLSDFDAGVR